MEVYEWKDRPLLIKLLVKLWNEDRETYYAFKEGLIIIPGGASEQPDLVVLPGSAEQAFLDELTRREGSAPDKPQSC